ncbi:MAG: CusA/CzcA family heavy metal efflux RND transporter [Bacteroidales bacterium]
MLDAIIKFSLRNKLIIILFTLSVSAFGFYAISRISVGTVPDITNNQVQVITTSTSLSTQDIEQYITYPVELEMANLPGVTEIRSISKFGLSVVTIVFEERMGTYLPRQLIAEKIKSAAANIPEGFGTPEMGPITTGLGEIYQYILDVKPGYEDTYSITELRTIQDWIVKRQLSGISGVVEVNTWGGYLKQYEIAINPGLLLAANITLLDVFNAVESNNGVAGGAYIEKENQSFFIRGDGLARTFKDIEDIVVTNRDGVPVLVRDIAEVRFGHANRFGAITANGEGEKVLGQIMMLKDADSKEVIKAVKERVAEVQESLPEGVFVNPIVERSELIGKTSFTVAENLILGCVIVIFVVLLLLGNFRSALVVASMIPLSLLFTISMMYIVGIDANLMSLGALDFGIIIDGAVIIVEYIAVRITASSRKVEDTLTEKRQTLIDNITFHGASRMMNSAIFGQVIILIVLIPILALSGVEGKMFQPMAMTFGLAIIGAMVFGLTWLPVASSLFLRPEKENRRNIATIVMDTAYRLYCPVMRWSYNHKRIVLGLAVASLLGTVMLFSRMGGEFIPTLDEGDFVIQPVLKTGTSLSRTIELTTQMENILIDNFPEVDQIVCRIGAAEVPTDPMSMEEIDMIIKLKSKKEWVTAKDKEGLAEAFKDALSQIPGIDYEFTQPIEMRFNELITGVRADIAVKIFGEDLDYLNTKAAEIRRLIDGIPGAADVIMEKTAGLPQMSVKYKRDKIAYHGLSVATLNRYLSMAFGGEAAGVIFEGERRFDVVVRFHSDHRQHLEDLMHLPVPTPSGMQIPLEELAEISLSQGPAKISRDNTHRRVVVSVNVRNRDLESVMNDIRSRIESQVTLDPGYYIDYGGQFENLENATRRLRLVVPVSLLLIFIFLHFAFKSLKDAVMIFSAIPLSAVGGVLLLWIRGMPFSVSAGIGFIALFGVAVLNGIVLIEHLKALRKSGITDMRELILKGAKERLRPVLLTASAAAMGFLPMAISTSAGAEVQRPLATVVIGGLVTATLLTMVALPLLFSIWYNNSGKRSIRNRIFNKKSTLMLALLVAAGGVTFAQPKPLTLEEAIDLGMQHNPSLKAYGLMIEQAQARLPASFALPQTALFYSYDQNNIAENGYPLKVIGAEQQLPFPTLFVAQKRAADLEVAIMTAHWEQQKIILTHQISNAWYQILYQKEQVLLYRELDSIYRQLSGAATTAYRQGAVPWLDNLTSQAEAEKSGIRLQQAEYSLSAALIQLQSLIQSNEPVDVAGTGFLPATAKPVSLENDPGYLVRLQRVQKGEAEMSVEKQKLMPELSFSAFKGSNPYANSQNYYGYQVGVGIPIFFGEQRAMVRSAKINIDIEENQLLNYKLMFENRKKQLEEERQKHLASLTFYENRGKELSEELIRAARKSFELGETDLFRYLQILESVIEMRMNYLDQLYEYNKTVMEINYLTIADF